MAPSDKSQLDVSYDWRALAGDCEGQVIRIWTRQFTGLPLGPRAGVIFQLRARSKAFSSARYCSPQYELAEDLPLWPD
jgi:hypothetical protein